MTKLEELYAISTRMADRHARIVLESYHKVSFKWESNGAEETVIGMGDDLDDASFCVISQLHDRFPGIVEPPEAI